MKIGIMTDLHLGLRQYGLKEREDDFYNQYNKAIDLFIKGGVDAVICAGDIFNQARPSPKAMGVFINGMKALSEHGIKLLNVIGNHSMIQASDFVTADELIFKLSGLTNGILLDKDDYFMLGNKDVCIFGLPYYFNFGIDKLIEDINGLNALAKNIGAKKNILVLHQSFKEFCGFTGEKLSIHDIDHDMFDLIICGHIHEKLLNELDENTVFLQPGSLERSNISEARDEENQGKGVFIIDTDKMDIYSIAEGFIRIPSDRKFFRAVMYMDQPNGIEAIEKEITDKIRNCKEKPLIDLTVHDSSNSFLSLMDLIKDLKSLCLTVHFNYIDESEEAEYKELMDKVGELTPRELLRLSLNPLEEDEAQLGLDLFDAFKRNEDVSGILDNFEKKHYQKQSVESRYNNEEFNQWIQEMENWVNS